ncbi:NAD+ synthase [Gynuella sp.]|uniref:NAD+ synthase n=1 Tax=Gynuella sp. TaxID=2969146 RepID=UPI003D0ED749
MSLNSLKVALAQDEFPVGDISGNAEKMITLARRAMEQNARVIVFPELTITGYPPEDLLLRPSMATRVEAAMNILLEAGLPIYMVVGFPKSEDGLLYNKLAVIYEGQILVEYAKQRLPNYQVFDEKRYFSEGQGTSVIEIDGFRCGLTICEDIWFDQPVSDATESGAEILFNINGSPYHIDRDGQRRDRVSQVAEKYRLCVVYVNHNCGQDELVFDGGSMVVTPDGVQHTLPTYESRLDIVELRRNDQDIEVIEGSVIPPRPRYESVYMALIQGLRAYVNRNGFTGVVMGLSGGIDSGLSLAIAVDALGPERVHAVMLPFEYTSQMSQDDAKTEAEALGVRYSVLPIVSMFHAGMETLKPLFDGLPVDTTEQNLQARIRGQLLMAISNKTGYMVLTTGNKSEMAVGYATLYGDMCGGFNVLKDVPKTLVFELARYRNTLSPVIPQRVIDRPPSAELAPDQKDEDSLPPYAILDQLIERYVENDESLESIVAAGFDRADVTKVIRLIDINEYKRRQAPEGVRITSRGFGRDRRYPITNAWKPGI